jgi:hypothetical protein
MSPEQHVAFPPGHFYSPELDHAALARERERVWGGQRLERIPGVDLALDRQRQLLLRAADFAPDYDYPDDGADGARGFSDRNPFFSGLDSRVHFALLRLLQPRRMIEVGSGHSSLLTADVNERFLGGRMDVTCIDPAPQVPLRPNLRTIPGISTVIERRVEHVGLEPFLALQAGDLLFIDSSHVVKTGNDVVFLYLQVLPRLAAGVVVHMHDIFLPDEYPEQWVLREQRSWNEQYLVQALLVDSKGFRVLFGSHSASLFLSADVIATFGQHVGGGSFWIQRTAGEPQREPW